MASSGMSFGGGFASGLAQALAESRQRADRERDRTIQNNWKLLSIALDSGQLGGIEDLQPFLDTMDLGFPKAKGKGKGGLNPQQHVSNMLGQIMQAGKGGPVRGESQGPLVPTGRPEWTNQPQVAGPDDAGNMYPVPNLESKPLAVPQAQPGPATRPSLMGIPILTQEQAADRRLGLEATNTLAKVKMVRERIYPALKATDPNATLEDAFAVAGIRMPSSLTGRPQSVAGEATGPDGKVYQTYAIFNGRQYIDPDTGAPIPDFRPRATTGSRSLGTALEAAAQELYNRPASQLTGEELTKAQERANLNAGNRTTATTTARVTATNQGVLDKPADFSTSRESNVPVGTTPREAMGQQVPTQEQVDRLRGLMDIKTNIEELLAPDDTGQSLLSVLPSKEGLEGLAPGAAYRLRKVQPAYRERVAKLEARVNSLVNVLARTVAEARGTQTEQDAERAYKAIVDLQGRIFSGDTQESAEARVKETLRLLDTLMKSAPKPVTPDASQRRSPNPTKPAPATGATGAVMRDGHLFINGVQID